MYNEECYARNNYGGYPNQPMQQNYRREPYDDFDMPPAYPDFGGYNAYPRRNRQMPGNGPWMPQSAPCNPAPAQTNPKEGCEHSAAAVRQCSSYDPSLNLEKIPGYKEGDPEQDYLGVQQRKIWYLLWCQENGCEPCIQVSRVSMVGDFLVQKTGAYPCPLCDWRSSDYSDAGNPGNWSGIGRCGLRNALLQ